jgi:hypothetical protein
MIDENLIAELREKLKRTADWEYFFSRLDSSEWAQPLFDAGFFGAPYAPIQDGTTYQLPSWPPSMYLARVAGQDPAVIASIVERIPDTDNTRIHRDLMEALIPSPTETLRSMLPPMKNWLHSRFLSLILLEPAAQLVVALAQRGLMSESLDLLENWLSPGSDNDGVIWQPSDWEYGEALDRTVPELAAIDSKLTLRTLVRILDHVQRQELQRDPTDNSTDYSTTWRPAIEDNEQNHLDFEKSGLLVHVRNTARIAGSGDCGDLAEAIAILKEGRWRVFDRLSLNLAREVGEACPELLGELLLDDSIFDNFDGYHEWVTLAHDRLGVLSQRDRTQFIDRIFDGPDTDAFRIRHQELYIEEPTEERVLDYVDHWRARRLSMIRQWLPPVRTEEAAQISARVTEDPHPDFLSWSSGVMTGPSSPLTSAQISELSNEELMAFLDTWEPESGFMLPSVEGLGRMLAEVIKSEPSRYLPLAENFIGRRPNYVRAVFDAVRSLLADSNGIHPHSSEWPLVLKLADWVTQQEIGDSSVDQFDYEVSWINTRKTIGHVLDTAISTKRLPLELSDRVWNIIFALLSDPQPTIEYERQLLESMDPGMIAINTVRGTAMHAAFKFLMWPERLDGDPESDAVLAAITDHLDTDRDASLGVRSVFGWVFPGLRSRFPGWASAHADAVFPLDPILRAFLDAAWDVYVARWRPGPDDLALLRERYGLAIDRLGDSGGDQHRVGSLSTRDQSLAEHLAWLYTFESLDFGDELLAKFFAEASVELRSHATAFFGKMFLNNSPPDEQIRARLIRWWTSAQVRCVEAEDLTELATLGWWTWAADAEPAWYLDEMENILRSGVQLDGGHFYIASLARLAPDWPAQVLACIKLVEAQGHQPWLFYGYNEEIQQGLRAALAADPATRAAAAAFIDLLAAKGSADFGQLLDEE